MRVLAILIIAFVADLFIDHLIERVIRRIVRRGTDTHEAEKKREDTLITVATNSITVVIFIIALFTVLSEFGVDIGPLLAAAGIVGIAVGFGGQYLMRDLISGVFMLLENQYRVGDMAQLNGTRGIVETLTLRMTTIRDTSGTVHYFPHGAVQSVANFSKEFARINFNVGVSYGADMQKVIEVVTRVGEELFADPVWKEKMVTAPQFVRVDDFGDSAISIKIIGDTKPSMQWEVSGEMRLRLKKAFDANGIEIPFPQRVVHNGK